jgi:putative ABC transport system permease protein
MAIPLKYNIGSLTSRRVSMALTILGIGTVIAVMTSMLALYEGVRTAVVSSGSPDNLLVLREGALTEATSWVTHDALGIIRSLPGVAKGADGNPLVSPELVILFKLPRKDDPKGGNVNVRGVTPAAFEMRPNVRLIGGRMFRPGVGEVIVSDRVRRRFANLDPGSTLTFGPRTWTVVGVFDAKGTSFDSEIWTDAGYLGLARRRHEFSSVLVRPVDRAAAASIISAIKGDNRLELLVKSEAKYYAEQVAGLIGVVLLVGFVTIFMIIGATLGTMNTMFSAVASRQRELATMRALGFSRRAVVLSMVIESALVALAGGVAGILLAFPVNGISTGTVNFNTFSEVDFNFRISPMVMLFALGLSLASGVIGGMWPAIRAARLPIVRALREI